MDDEQLITAADGATICLQTTGAVDDPVVLLIAGMCSSMDWWEVELCERLADTGRRVVRYDHRDTGRSSVWPVGQPGYTSADLAADALDVLDHLSCTRAHVVGLSMGGGIAQTIALDHPDRVATLTLISTAPIGDVGRPLPTPLARLMEWESTPRPEPDWSDAEAVAEFMLPDLHVYAGSVRFDPVRMHELIRVIHARTRDVRASNTNHAVLLGEPDGVVRRLDLITAATLVLHGTEDPLFPPPTGRLLADAIPGARLVELEGVGHEYPPRQVWDQVITELTRHTTVG